MANVIDIITRSRNDASAGLEQTTRSVQGLNRAMLLLPPSTRLALKQFEGLAAVGGRFGAVGIGIGALALSMVGLGRAAQIAFREVAELSKKGEDLRKMGLISTENAAQLKALRLEVAELGFTLQEIKIDALLKIAPFVESALEDFNKLINRLRLIPALIAITVESARVLWKSLDPRTAITEGFGVYAKLLSEVNALAKLAGKITVAEDLAEVTSAADEAAKKLKAANEAAKQLAEDAAMRAKILAFAFGMSQVPVPLPDRRPRKDFGSFGVPTLAEVPEGKPRALDLSLQVLGNWRSTIDEITASATVLDETLSGLFSGLQSGFTQVFQNLLGSTQTFASAMKTLFRSLVNEILAELARLAAAKVFQFLLSLLGGGIAGGSGSAPSNPAGVTGGATTITPLGARPAGPTTIYLSTIDSRSMLEQFRSRLGSINVVDDRLSLPSEV